MANLVFHPNDEFRVGNFIISNLENRNWTLFRGAVAFAKNSGVKYLYRPLMVFTSRRNTNAILTIGIDSRGTSFDALMNLRDALKRESELWIFHNRDESVTFHPKIFMFANNQRAKVAVGSGNLTEGGLFSNYEAFTILDLEFSSEQDTETYQKLIMELDTWKDENGGCAIPGTENVLTVLREADKLPTETVLRRERGISRRRQRQVADNGNVIDEYFQRARTQHAPRQDQLPAIQVGAPLEVEVEQPEVEEVDEQEGLYKVFYMTLKRTDVGYGQTTPGTSRRSPEVFIPLIARNADPIFWGWRAMFTEDPGREGKYDRQQVPMLIDGNIELVNMMTWPVKSDFRIRSEALRRNANIDDIIRIERGDGTRGYQYR